MKESRLPAPAPAEITVETRPFWEGTARHALLLQRCDACGVTVWYPRSHCPDCGGRALTWREASGRGRIYSFTVVRRGQGRYRDAAPYVLAYVELDEGVRMLTNVVDADLDRLEIGARVEVVFHDTGEGTALPRFRPRV
jgi:uncharacterized OB-fold protein